jgi:hypothetical protein
MALNSWKDRASVRLDGDVTFVGDEVLFTACSPSARDQKRVTVGKKPVIFNRVD